MKTGRKLLANRGYSTPMLKGDLWKTAQVPAICLFYEKQEAKDQFQIFIIHNS
jgi:hypothetical protein